ATQGVFTLPANTQFGVSAFANSAGTQTVNVQVNNETVATFTGQSTNNGIIGSKVLNSGGGVSVHDRRTTGLLRSDSKEVESKFESCRGMGERSQT
ncbi:fucose-binding lectin II, partial [Pseudomonas aeruginosa]